MDMVGYPTRCQQIWRLKKRVGLCYGFIGVRLMTTGIFPRGRKTLGMGISNTYLRYLEITGEEHAITEWYDSGHRLVGFRILPVVHSWGRQVKYAEESNKELEKELWDSACPFFSGGRRCIHWLHELPLFFTTNPGGGQAQKWSIYQKNRHASNLYTIYTQSIHNLYTIYTQSIHNLCIK